MADDQGLVRITKYSNKIRELSIVKRISVEYPLYCRDEVAKMLANAAETLPFGLHLQVDSAYRTRKTQEILWEARKTVMPGLVSNPAEGIPPHCTGGAVDVSLVDEKGEEINLSEPFSKYYDEPQLVSEKISSKAQELRLLLNKIMLDQGFAPNPKEYWHFSYGEKSWAEFFKHELKYSEVEIPKGYYYLIYIRIYYKLLRRLWKLINKLFAIQTNY